jgi:hypothetical protein
MIAAMNVAKNAAVIAAVIAAGSLALARPAAADPAAAPPDLLLVIGAAGSPEYAARFREASTRWQRTGSRARATVRVVGEPTEKEIGRASAGSSDRQRLQAAIGQLATGSSTLWLVFIGHGTYDGRTARFNLRGPDVSAAELAAWLKPVSRPLVFVNAASASAPFLRAVTGAGRVVVTATKTGGEFSAPRFGGAFAEAIGDARADLDRDGGVSVLEAFLHASKRVESSFAEEGLLASEHALLEDNGDGLGTSAAFFRGMTANQPTAGGQSTDGDRARQITLVPAPPDLALTPALRRRRDQLEAELFALREQRAKLPEATYFARLERLLVPLARVYAQAQQSIQQSRSTPGNNGETSGVERGKSAPNGAIPSDSSSFKSGRDPKNDD